MEKPHHPTGQQPCQLEQPTQAARLVRLPGCCLRTSGAPGVFASLMPSLISVDKLLAFSHSTLVHAVVQLVGEQHGATARQI